MCPFLWLPAKYSLSLHIHKFRYNVPAVNCWGLFFCYLCLLFSEILESMVWCDLKKFPSNIFFNSLMHSFVFSYPPEIPNVCASALQLRNSEPWGLFTFVVRGKQVFSLSQREKLHYPSRFLTTIKTLTNGLGKKWGLAFLAF